MSEGGLNRSGQHAKDQEKLNEDAFVEEGEEEEVIASFELTDTQSAAIIHLLAHGMPVVQSGHWLRQGWEGLGLADIAVVNARAAHADTALATLKALEALKGDERWHATLPAFRRFDTGPRRCFGADFANARDPEARRLVGTIKRRWR